MEKRQGGGRGQLKTSCVLKQGRSGTERSSFRWRCGSSVEGARVGKLGSGRALAKRWGKSGIPAPTRGHRRSLITVVGGGGVTDGGGWGIKTNDNYQCYGKRTEGEEKGGARLVMTIKRRDNSGIHNFRSIARGAGQTTD